MINFPSGKPEYLVNQTKNSFKALNNLSRQSHCFFLKNLKKNFQIKKHLFEMKDIFLSGKSSCLETILS